MFILSYVGTIVRRFYPEGKRPHNTVGSGSSRIEDEGFLLLERYPATKDITLISSGNDLSTGTSNGRTDDLPAVVFNG